MFRSGRTNNLQHNSGGRCSINDVTSDSPSGLVAYSNLILSFPSFFPAFPSLGLLHTHATSVLILEIIPFNATGFVIKFHSLSSIKKGVREREFGGWGGYSSFGGGRRIFLRDGQKEPLIWRSPPINYSSRAVYRRFFVPNYDFSFLRPDTKFFFISGFHGNRRFKDSLALIIFQPTLVLLSRCLATQHQTHINARAHI